MRVITTCVGCLSNAIFVTDNYEDHIHSHGFRRLVERKKTRQAHRYVRYCNTLIDRTVYVRKTYIIYANQFQSLRWVWVSFAETGLTGLNLSLHGTLCPSTGHFQNVISLCGTCGIQFVPPRDFYKNSI